MLDTIKPVQESRAEMVRRQSAWRFPTPHKETAPRYHYRGVETGKLDVIGSLDWLRVEQGMLANAPRVYDEQGRVWCIEMKNDEKGDALVLKYEGITIEFARLERNERGFYSISYFNEKAVQFVRGAYVVPVGGWGNEFAVMIIDFGTTHIDRTNGYIPPAMNDLPDHILEVVLPDQAQITQHLLDTTGNPVFLGYCNSAGGIFPGTLGLMSVLYPHGQIAQVSPELSKKLTVEEIKRVRKDVPWDEGIATYLAGQAIPDLQKDVHDYWGSAQITQDNMGFSIYLPDFKTTDLASLAFMRNFWGKISLTIHHHLRQAHEKIWPSDLDSVIRYVLEAHKTGVVNIEEYKQLFFPYMKDLPIELSGIAKLEAQNILRKPIGWAGGMRIDEKGLFVTITYGTMDINTGVDEGNAICLVRPAEPLSVSEIAIKDAYHDEVLAKSIG